MTTFEMEEVCAMIWDYFPSKKFEEKINASNGLTYNNAILPNKATEKENYCTTSLTSSCSPWKLVHPLADSIQKESGQGRKAEATVKIINIYRWVLRPLGLTKMAFETNRELTEVKQKVGVLI